MHARTHARTQTHTHIPTWPGAAQGTSGDCMASQPGLPISTLPAFESFLTSASMHSTSPAFADANSAHSHRRPRVHSCIFSYARPHTSMYPRTSRMKAAIGQLDVDLKDVNFYPDVCACVSHARAFAPACVRAHMHLYVLDICTGLHLARSDGQTDKSMRICAHVVHARMGARNVCKHLHCTDVGGRPRCDSASTQHVKVARM